MASPSDILRQLQRDSFESDLVAAFDAAEALYRHAAADPDLNVNLRMVGFLGDAYHALEHARYAFDDSSGADRG